MLVIKQSRYDLMEGQQVDESPEVWPDCLSIDLDLFPRTSSNENVFVYQKDTIRPDRLFYNKIGTNNLEDIVLWLNQIPSRRDLEPALSLLFPSRTDINSYYISSRKVN